MRTAKHTRGRRRTINRIFNVAKRAPLAERGLNATVIATSRGRTTQRRAAFVSYRPIGRKMETSGGVRTIPGYKRPSNGVGDTFVFAETISRTHRGRPARPDPVYSLSVGRISPVSTCLPVSSGSANKVHTTIDTRSGARCRDFKNGNSFSNHFLAIEISSSIQSFRPSVSAADIRYPCRIMPSRRGFRKRIVLWSIDSRVGSGAASRSKNVDRIFPVAKCSRFLFRASDVNMTRFLKMSEQIKFDSLGNRYSPRRVHRSNDPLFRII